MPGRPIRSRFLTATPVEEHGTLFPVPWIGLPPDTAAPTNNCIGVSNGVATVTGTLYTRADASASSAGSASVTGSLDVVTKTTGASDGATTVTGNLGVGMFRGGASDGSATVTGTLKLVHWLSGTSDGAATVTGSFAIGNVFGQSDGSSTAAGSLFQVHAAAGTSAGVATVSGHLWNYKQGELEGWSAGSASVSGKLRGTARITQTSVQAVVQPGAGNVRVTQTSLQILVRIDPTIAGASDGTSTVTGTLYVGHFLEGRSDGSAYVYGYIGNDRYLEGVIQGQATVTGSLHETFSTYIPSPIPYRFPHLSPFTHEIVTLILGDSTVTGSLYQVHSVDAGSGVGGTSTVSGTLTQIVPDDPETPDTMTASSAGVATVVGELDGSYLYAELAGQSDGVATVTHVLAADALYQIRGLYMFNNVGPGHSPTDDKSGISGFVSQTFPDGTIDDTVRHLYSVQSVGPGFNPTDDKSAEPGFVSQVFPDGGYDTISRYLYLPQYVFALPDEPRRLTIGPTPKLPTSMLRGKPPVSQVGRGPEVV